MTSRDDNWERPADYAPPYNEEDKNLLLQEISNLGVGSILEFGPGDSTEFMSCISVRRLLANGKSEEKPLPITTCEHLDKWYNVNRERFKDKPQIRVLKYHNEMPVVVEGLGDDERFDLGFVDSPQGYNPVRKAFPGYEDCSRFNTTLFAIQRCRAVILHDVMRPLERGTLGRLNAMGYEYNFLNPNTALITHGDKIRFDLPSPEKSGGAPAGAESVSGGIPVDQRPDRLDASGVGKKRHRVRQGRGQSGGRVRSASRPHHSVEGSAGVRRGKRSSSRGAGDSGRNAPSEDGGHASH